MNILLANNHRRLIGGVERYLDTLIPSLRGHGHKVRSISCDPAIDVAESQGDDIVLPGRDVRDQSLWNGLKALYRFDIAGEWSRLAGGTMPDIVHMHLFDVQLTSAFVEEVLRRRIPIVQTAHDHRAVCPVATRHNGRRVCGDCLGRWPIGVLRHRCNQGSMGRSLFSFADALLAKFGGYYEAIAKFISPSRFVADSLVDGGIDRRRVVVIPYAYPVPAATSRIPDESCVLFAGRMHFTKGVNLALRLVAALPGIRFRFAGRGPQEGEVRAAAKRYPNMEYLGFLGEAALLDQMRRARCLLVPSEWYDNQPLSIIEAQAIGIPVIGSRIGGIPEMISDGHSGLLCEPGDLDGFADAVQRLVLDEALAEDYGNAAHRWAASCYDVEHHVQEVVSIYRDVI